MQLKWLEDFQTLAETRSFTRAAELCHVTQPAFGRRIKALEAWVGAPLVQRTSGPVSLTQAGENFLEMALQSLAGLQSAREEVRQASGAQQRAVTLATGATLARTRLADWLVRLTPLLRQGEMRITTRPHTEVVQMLEQHEADFAMVCQHPVLTLRLDARRFTHLTLAPDRLVPVSRATVQARPAHAFADKPVPYLAYAHSMALGRLVEDHLSQNPAAPRLQRRLVCGSADALHDYVLKGVGIAWLPWSLIQADCRAGRLVVLGDKRDEIGYDVRLYRAKRRLSPLAEQVWLVFANAVTT